MFITAAIALDAQKAVFEQSALEIVIELLAYKNREISTVGLASSGTRWTASATGISASTTRGWFSSSSSPRRASRSSRRSTWSGSGARPGPAVRAKVHAGRRLLADVDEVYGQMSGLATREVLRRQFDVFGDTRFERLATISKGHVYNLRGSATYRAKRTVWTKTQGTAVAIGLRQAPEPERRPGHARVDTVHQGDRDGVKGLYLINLVDEVTQYEFVGAVDGISERFLLALLEGLLLSFPFPILSFHADNGSEYINHRVAESLEKLRVERFTKSRARTSNDNALVEGKNASVVRRWFGHDHIPQRFAPDVSRFAHDTLSPFLNFHRPCLFATEYRDPAGKIRRKYLARDVMTPYAKFRSLPNAEVYLKPGMDFALLDAAAAAETDLHAARRRMSDATPNAVPQPRAGGQPPNPRPRRGAGYSPLRRVKGPLRRPRRLDAMPEPAADARQHRLASPSVALALDPPADHVACPNTYAPRHQSGT